jgi:hypothetical protein
MWCSMYFMAWYILFMFYRKMYNLPWVLNMGQIILVISMKVLFVMENTYRMIKKSLCT